MACGGGKGNNFVFAGFQLVLKGEHGVRFFIRILFFCLVFVFVMPFLGLAQNGNGANSAYVTSGKTVSGVAAVVNGEMVSLRDLQQQSAPEIARARITRNDPKAEEKVNAIQRKVLDSIVLDILIRQEAERFGVKASEADVDAEIKKILTNNKIDLITLERSLVSQGLSLDFLKQRIRNNTTNSRLMQMMVTHKVLVPTAELEKYYNAHPEEFMKDKKVTLQVIMFPPQLHAEADGIVAKIKSGQLSFEQAAKTYSVGPKADQGGKIGAINWEELSPLWRKALAGVRVGGISPIFLMEESDAILKLAGEEPGQPKSFKEAELEVEAILKEPLLQERYKEYTKGLRDKAVVDIRF